MKQQAIDILDEMIQDYSYNWIVNTIQENSLEIVIMKKIKGRILALPDEWISVNDDSIPQLMRECMVYATGNTDCVTHWFYMWDWIWETDLRRVVFVTHWQPLPLPPKQ